MKVQRRFALGLALVVVASAVAAGPALASGLKSWSTSSPANGYATVDKSLDGCKARGIANNASGYVSTAWIDSTASAGYYCAFVRANGYVFGGSAGYWTGWEKDELVVKIKAAGITQGKHELFTE